MKQNMAMLLILCLFINLVPFYGYADNPIIQGGEGVGTQFNFSPNPQDATVTEQVYDGQGTFDKNTSSYIVQALDIISRISTYSEATAKEQKLLSDFYGTDKEAFLYCEAKGYTLKETINLVVLSVDYEISIQDAERITAAKGDIDTVRNILGVFDVFRKAVASTVTGQVYGADDALGTDGTVVDQVYGMGDSYDSKDTVMDQVYGKGSLLNTILNNNDTVVNQVYGTQHDSMKEFTGEVIDRIIDGHEVKDIWDAYNLSQVLQIDWKQIVRKDPNENVEEAIAALAGGLTTEEIEIITWIAHAYYTDIDRLIAYKEQLGKSWQEINDIIRAYEESKLQPNTTRLLTDLNFQATYDNTPDSFDYDKYFNDLYAIKQNSNESISPSTGALTYEHNLLYLSGRNGLDLDIKIRYNSADANLYSKRYYEEPVYGGKPPIQFKASGVVNAYAYSSGTGWIPCPVKDVIGSSGERTMYATSTNYSTVEGKAQEWEQKTHIKKQNGLYLLAEYVANVSIQKNEVTGPEGLGDYRFYNDRLVVDDRYINNYVATGWSLAVPSIGVKSLSGSSEKEPAYVQLMDGSTYRIRENSYSVFADYTVEDMKLTKDATFSNGDINSTYALLHKDGRKEYFSEDGRYLGIVDRYNNSIKYRYSTYKKNTRYNITKIIDSLNREIAVFSVDGAIISAPGDIKVRIEKEYVHIEDKYKSMAASKLSKIIDPLGRETHFEYQKESGIFSFVTKFADQQYILFPYRDGRSSNEYINLTKIFYPTGGQSRYQYEKATRNLGHIGFQEYYRIKSREDIENGISYNRDIYTYEGNYSGYPNNRYVSTHRPANLQYTTTIQKIDGITGKYSFDNRHVITQEETKDPAGKLLNKATYEYDVHKFKTKEKTTLYDASGTSLTKEESWKYDNYGDLTDYTDPLGNTTTYTYDNKFHQLTSETRKMDGSREQKTEYIVNPNTGNIDQMIQRLGTKAINTYFTYDSYGNVISTRRQKEDGTFVTENYGYSPAYNGGYLTQKSITVTNYQGSQQNIIEKYTYDFNTGNLRTFTDGRNHTTTYDYDILGRKTKVTNPDGSAKTINYDDTNRIITLKQENGHQTKNIYDGLGRLKTKQQLKNGQYITILENQYNPMGQISSTKDAKGNTTSYEYDSLGRVTKVTNPDNTITKTDYYDGSNKKVETNEEGTQYATYYDKIGNIIKETAAGITTEYRYDLAGNRIYQKDPKGYETHYTYDQLNRLIEITNPKGEKTKYEYDNLNNHVKTIQQEYDGSGILNRQITTTKKQDERGRTIQSTDPLGKSDYYAYDMAGNLDHKKDKEGQRINYTYDSRNRVLTQTAKNQAGTTTDQTTYDYANYYTQNKLAVTHNGRKTTYEYYSDGALKKEEIQPDNKVTYYEYDNNGNRIKMTDPYGLTVDYTYDTRNRLDLLKIDNAKVFDYDYYTDGMIKTIKYPTATLMTSFTYDNINRLTSLNNNIKNLTDNYAYGYDNNSNITTITENNERTTYEYDPLNRLKQTDRINDTNNTTYEYDARGNRTKARGYIASFSTSEPAQFKYNALEQLTQHISNGLVADYKYNQSGLRTEKKIPTGEITKYYYDNTGRTIAEASGNGNITAQVIWGHKPLARKISGKYYYYLYNGHGDVVQMVDESGNIVNSYKYDEWGNITEKQETIENPIRYAGEYYDEESGLYYLRARYYDPVIGRFITRDSYEGQLTNPLSLNLYTYCTNNPLIYVDPTGHLQEVGGGVLYNHHTKNYVNVRKKPQNVFKTYSCQEPDDMFPEEVVAGLEKGTMAIRDVAADAGEFSTELKENGVYTQIWINAAFTYAAEGLVAIQSFKGGTTPVHGNSKQSTKIQHGYEIFEKQTGDVVKTGISGQPLNKNATSPRANSQVNGWNKQAGYDKYGANVVEVNIPNRQSALDWELNNAMRLWEEGNSMIYHKIPRPWE